MDKCSFLNCNKPVFVKQTSLGPCCVGHYAQIKRGQTEFTSLRGYSRHQPNANHSTCPFTGCERPSWHKQGYCQTHQRQLWNKQVLQPIRLHLSQDGNLCQTEGCDRPAKCRGYCSKHYRQDWGKCILPDCSCRMHNKKTGYCYRHYKKARKLGISQ
jgi:hypothetical protein